MKKPTIVKLYHLCDFCQHEFAECDAAPVFIIDHPNYRAMYEQDAELHHRDLVYECRGFKKRDESDE